MFDKFMMEMAISLLSDKLEDFCKKDENVEWLVDALYNKSVTEFVAEAMEKLGNRDDLDEISVIDLFKEAIEPLDDDYENLIVKLLDGIKPRK